MGRDARRRGSRAKGPAPAPPIVFDELDLYKLRTTLAESNQVFMQAQQQIAQSRAKVDAMVEGLAAKYHFPPTARRFTWDEQTRQVTAV